MSKQRSEPRLPTGELSALVRVTLGPEGSGVDGAARLLDFSQHGLRVRVTRPYEAGALIPCRITLTTVEEQTLTFDAEVRWCLRHGEADYEAGARIIGGPAAARLLIFERFLNYHRAPPRPRL
jgi:PilZ domain